MQPIPFIIQDPTGFFSRAPGRFFINRPYIILTAMLIIIQFITNLPVEA